MAKMHEAEFDPRHLDGLKRQTIIRDPSQIT